MANAKDLTVDDKLVRALAALLDETGLTEIEYAVGDHRIRVARSTTLAPAALAIPAAAPLSAASAEGLPAAAAHPGAVKAPMVGTAYLSPQPGAPAFVKVGDSVREGESLLIIEAMKVMNQIPSPRAGRVAQILVADGAPVEYGQALIVLE
ncbi:MAG TPA: acetyl-CoA carboxylase biotin carboxyl carrier protein subunit [Stellaceae bacterium]|jgi:acetyl-CoA carboxylase biotin carboxyl carrier protein|nr:acetyl-CoA carboxylase biotin carboxyl carrier protein subunit [Stellaceae bacterium]